MDKVRCVNCGCTLFTKEDIIEDGGVPVEDGVYNTQCPNCLNDQEWEIKVDFSIKEIK